MTSKYEQLALTPFPARSTVSRESLQTTRPKHSCVMLRVRGGGGRFYSAFLFSSFETSRKIASNPQVDVTLPRRHKSPSLSLNSF